MLRRLFFSCTLAIPVCAHELKVTTGSLKGETQPGADFFVSQYAHAGFRAGTYTAPERLGIFASYSLKDSPFVFEAGSRENSLEEGFMISNGAWLPWTKSFAFLEPQGARMGYKTKFVSSDIAYYQRDDETFVHARLTLQPITFLSVYAGAATEQVHTTNRPQFMGGMRWVSARFTGGAEIYAETNYLAHARFSADWTLRGLAFYQTEPRALASGIYENKKGGALQFFYGDWFLQAFATQSSFALAKYASGQLAAVAVYEEKNQLAGASLKSAATGFHVRGGVSVARDGGLHSLAGFGHGEVLFVGGGHFDLKADQPLEPLIFPAEWYSSVLLQSTPLRVAGKGFKLMALVDTGAIQGFMAVTWSEASRERDQFAFHLRLSGAMSF